MTMPKTQTPAAHHAQCSGRAWASAMRKHKAQSGTSAKTTVEAVSVTAAMLNDGSTLTITTAQPAICASNIPRISRHTASEAASTSKGAKKRTPSSFAPPISMPSFAKSGTNGPIS